MIVQTIYDVLWALVIGLWKFANTNFSLALFGAFAGAYGGQWIVERSNRKNRLLDEIRNTNAATTIALAVCNACLRLKSQHVTSLKANYDKQYDAYVRFNTETKNGNPENKEFRYLADFEFMDPLVLPIDKLQELLFEKIAISGRPMNIATTLSEVLAALNGYIEKRNDLIKENKEKGPMSHWQYFGVADGQGSQDLRYHTTIDGISDFTDYAIYFSYLLCGDLASHNKELANKFGKNAPSTLSGNFQAAFDENLMPDSKLFSGWNRAFENTEKV